MTSQSADNNANAIIIQNTGNNVVITVGASVLTFERTHLLSTRIATTDLHLLIPEYRQSTLVGRAPDLAALHQWRNTDTKISARCLTGRAGAGKTRLAIDFCEQAEADNWQAGFLRHASRTHDLGQWRWQKPTLLVIDYAATSARPLRTWLDSLARRTDDPPPLLLLERYATPGAGWFQDVFGQGTLTIGAADLLDPPEPIPLPPLASAADRRALLTDIMTQAAVLARISSPG